MVSVKVLVFCFGLFAIQLRSVRGITDKEKSGLFAAVLPHVLECTGKFDLGVDIGKLIENPTDFSDVNPCLVACVLKKLKLMNSKGMYDSEKGKKIGKKYFSSEEDRKTINEVTDTCAKVNEKDVTDGEKGCERAKMLLDCFAPNIELFLPSN